MQSKKASQKLPRKSLVWKTDNGRSLRRADFLKCTNNKKIQFNIKSAYSNKSASFVPALDISVCRYMHIFVKGKRKEEREKGRKEKIIIFIKFSK